MNENSSGMNGIGLYRSWRNGTFIRFYDATMNGTAALEYDCGWSPNVIYLGSTININAPYPWTPGHQYYVTFDSGRLPFFVVQEKQSFI